MTTFKHKSPTGLTATSRIASLMTAWCLVGLLSGCSTLDSASNSVVSTITPYRPEVVQGNVVTKEQVALLRTGLTKLQVRQLLGTPLVTSVFHANRWDYVFTINRQGTEPQQRRLTIYFENDRLARYEGDAMPSEQEFIQSITKPGASKDGKNLQASPEQLSKFRDENPVVTVQPLTSTPPASLNTAYPPLESGVRQ